MFKKIIIALFVFQGSLAQAQTNSSIDFKSLGFNDQDVKQDAELEKTLQDRKYYLRQHHVWGLVSAGAMTLAALSGGEGELPPEHPYIAGLAFTAYAASAYTAWKAPGLPEEKEKGGSAWHRNLVWIHLPGMILAPILGYMAAKKIEKGEELDGAEKYHRDVAGVTAVALLISAATVSFEF